MSANGRTQEEDTPLRNQVQRHRIYDYSRVLCFAECNGDLYMAARITTGEDWKPVDGGLYRRVDGPKPSWQLVYRWPVAENVPQSRFLRGLTAVPDPRASGRQVLLAAFEYPGIIVRIDPGKDVIAPEQELDIKEFFNQAWNTPTARRRGAIAAYNRFLPVTDPDTGEKAHLLGLWINHPDRRATENGASAWYLVRHADGTYGHGRVFDPKHPKPNPPRGLLATRTIEVSPFPEDKGRVLYFGGFDCANIESHNTAWIYKGTLSAPEKDKP
jgi:hypothetical protein